LELACLGLCSSPLLQLLPSLCPAATITTWHTGSRLSPSLKPPQGSCVSSCTTAEAATFVILRRPTRPVHLSFRQRFADLFDAHSSTPPSFSTVNIIRPRIFRPTGFATPPLFDFDSLKQGFLASSFFRGLRERPDRLRRRNLNVRPRFLRRDDFHPYFLIFAPAASRLSTFLTDTQQWTPAVSLRCLTLRSTRPTA
jgi:hypothetical protein